MSSAKVVVETERYGYVVYVQPKGSAFAATLGDAVGRDGARVDRPVLVGEHIGATPGAALDAALAAARRVFENRV